MKHFNEDDLLVPNLVVSEGSYKITKTGSPILDIF